MYRLDVLVQGFPGKSPTHGGLGWSTVALLRGGGAAVIVDTGHYMHRDVLPGRLRALGLDYDDVTAVALTHAHWDHCANFALFRNARVYLSRTELAWAAAQPIGAYPIAEFHVEKLASASNVTLLDDGDEIAPGLRALATPGHTPGHLAYVAQADRGCMIFTGDAIKNASECACLEVDSTLDRETSLASVRRLRELAAADPANEIVPGHDRTFRFDGRCVEQIVPLACELTARRTDRFDEQDRIDLGAQGYQR